MIEQTRVKGIYVPSSKGLAKGLAELTMSQAEPISLRDYAQSSMKTENFWYLPGGIVREGIVIIPGKKTLLIRDTPLLDPRIAEQYEREFLDRKSAIEAEINSAYPQGKSMSSEEFKRKTKLRYSADIFAFPIDPAPYLWIALQDKDKKPEQRRVLDVDYSQLGNKSGYEGIRFMPFTELSKEEIFRWAFRDIALDWAKYLYNGFGSGREEKDYCVLIGGPDIKEIYGDVPFVAPFWYSACEKGEFGFKTGEKVHRSKWLAKRKGE